MTGEYIRQQILPSITLRIQESHILIDHVICSIIEEGWSGTGI